MCGLFYYTCSEELTRPVAYVRYSVCVCVCATCSLCRYQRVRYSGFITPCNILNSVKHDLGLIWKLYITLQIEHDLRSTDDAFRLQEVVKPL